MRWLERHAYAPSAIGSADQRVAWLTGQSSWSNSLLSPRQHAVLDAVAEHGWTPLRVGFPWTCLATIGSYRVTPLPVASVRNGTQFLAARFSKRFAEQIAEHVQTLFDRTSSRLLLLCGSAGTQILAAAARHVRVPQGLDLVVVALGPVGRSPEVDGRWNAVSVQGRQDWISRLSFRGTINYQIPGGHLSAGTSPEAIGIILRVAAGRPGSTWSARP